MEANPHAGAVNFAHVAHIELAAFFFSFFFLLRNDKIRASRVTSPGSRAAVFFRLRGRARRGRRRTGRRLRRTRLNRLLCDSVDPRGVCEVSSLCARVRVRVRAAKTGRGNKCRTPRALRPAASSPPGDTTTSPRHPGGEAPAAPAPVCLLFFFRLLFYFYFPETKKKPASFFRLRLEASRVGNENARRAVGTKLPRFRLLLHRRELKVRRVSVLSGWHCMKMCPPPPPHTTHTLCSIT